MIEAYQQENGYPPTRVEIAQFFGFRSSNAAEEHIKALVRKGFIDRMHGQSRGIRLRTKAASDLPVVSGVLDGSRILDQNNIHERLGIRGSTFSPHADFLLQLNQDCFDQQEIPELSHGDLLAIHTTEVVAIGELALARAGNQLILKKVCENDSINPHLSHAPEPQPVIEGKAVGVIRRGLGPT